MKNGNNLNNADDLTALIAGAVGPGDAVMVKGSNGSRAGRIAAGLSRLGELV